MTEEHSFHSTLRILVEAHEREVSALQSKVVELERSAGQGRGSDSKNFADAAVQTDGEPLIDPQGTPQSGPPGAAERDYMASMMESLRAATMTKTTRELSQMNCPRRAAALARRVVRWHGFDACIGLVICTNAVCIGIDLDLVNRQQRPNGVLPVLEKVFLAVYTLELALRALAYGLRCFRDNWVKFDAVLISVAWVAELLQLVAGEVAWLDGLIIVRLLRLLRIFRAAKMMGRWKPLWKLVSGFLGSIETLFSTFLVLAFAVYIFSCFSMELIAMNGSLKADLEANLKINKYYNTFPATVMTTFQFVTMDGASEIYRPLIKAQPLLALFFPLIFAILPILLMNLVTAIIVEDAITSSQMDEATKRLEMKRKCKELEPKIRKAFQILDADGNGQVRMDDVVSADFTGMSGVDDISQLLTPQVLLELYDVLDSDGNGFISEDELVNGVTQLALSEASLEITEVKHLVKANARQVRMLKQDVEKILFQVGGTPVGSTTVHQKTPGWTT